MDRFLIDEGTVIERGFLILKKGQKAVYHPICDFEDKLIKVEIQLNPKRFGEIAGIIDVFKVKSKKTNRIYNIPSTLLFVPNQPVKIFTCKNSKGYTEYELEFIE